MTLKQKFQNEIETESTASLNMGDVLSWGVSIFGEGQVARWHPLPLHLRPLQFGRCLLRRLPLDLDGLPRCRNFLPPQRAPAILDRDAPVPPFTHQHSALRGGTLTALRRQLEPPILIPHHSVIADRALVLQTKDPIQFRRPRCATMVVLRLRRRARKPLVVFRQILPLQIHIGLFVTAALFAPQFLHQPVLMRAVLPLHSSLGLRRTGRDNLDPQLPAHPPKLRDRLFSPQLLLHCGRTFVQILPIHVHRLRHSVALDPGAQRIDHRPDRLLLAQPRPRRAGGVIHQVDQAAPRSPFFQPGVEAAVQLHHLSKMLLALAPPKVPPPFPLATPQAFRQHPPPQRFGVHFQSVLGFQVLGRQRRTKALPYRSSVLVPHSPQHLLSKLLVVGPIRAAPRAAVL